MNAVLGVYAILDKLGEGGMGSVYKARHEMLGRLVALKVIRPDRLANPENIARFQHEARLIAQLQHPNIVAVYDANEAEGVYFIAMEYVEGTDLAKWLKEHGPLSVPEACEYIRQAAIGLQHAHERGLVHRDLKPSNLILVQNRAASPALVKILDFGLARFSGPSTDASSLTRSGDIMGTPEFMAPEQAFDSKQADIRSDIFSLGCSLYYLLTGSYAFSGQTPAERLAARLAEATYALQLPHPGIPKTVEPVLLKMLNHSPANRFQTPLEVARALEPFCHGESSRPVFETPVGPRINDPREVASTTGNSFQGKSTSLPQNFTPSSKRSTLSDPRLRTASPRIRHLVLGGGIGLLVLGAVIVYFNRPRTDPDHQRSEEAHGVLTNSIGMTLALIPGGSFLMGSPSTEVGRDKDEGPQHRVQITRSFYLGVHEVTQDEYRQIAGNNPSFFSSAGGGALQVQQGDTSHFPVEMVSWEDAMAFCHKLSELPAEQSAKRRYRLPTEAEWEYACRAGTQSPFFHGETCSSTQANVQGNSPYGGAAKGPVRMQTVPVESFSANPYGLYDMHGNVWEWCADTYGPYPSEVQVDPQGPPAGTERVLRGGAWGFAASDSRSARRIARTSSTRNSYYGFRVLCESK